MFDSYKLLFKYPPERYYISSHNKCPHTKMQALKNTNYGEFLFFLFDYYTPHIFLSTFLTYFLLFYRFLQKYQNFFLLKNHHTDKLHGDFRYPI